METLIWVLLVKMKALWKLLTLLSEVVRQFCVIKSFLFIQFSQLLRRQLLCLVLMRLAFTFKQLHHRWWILHECFSLEALFQPHFHILACFEYVCLFLLFCFRHAHTALTTWCNHGIVDSPNSDENVYKIMSWVERWGF